MTKQNNHFSSWVVWNLEGHVSAAHFLLCCPGDNFSLGLSPSMPYAMEESYT